MPAFRTHAPWLAALVLALGFLVCDALQRSRHIIDVTSHAGSAAAAPAIDAQSPTGYAHGVRSVVLPSRAMDGYNWIMQAQTAVARGEVRVRHVDYDDVPTGRDVHWAMPFRLYVIFLAWIDHLVRGDPWGIAIEHAAVVSGPLLLALALASLVPWLARGFSPWAAALFALGAVAAFPFYVDFVAGYADHHGLINLCALLSVLCLLDHRSNLVRARRGAIAAGIAGGVGLWISAATQIPVLIGLGAGALVLLWRDRRSAAPSLWSAQPNLFRWWAGAGAATSLLAYLAEYFPTHLALRLEVNHPLHALAWAGAGEMLYRLAKALCASDARARRADLLAALTAGTAVAILPATILLSPKSFLVADPFLWRLHRDFIAEFETLPDLLRESGYEWSSLACCLPLLLVLPALWLCWRGKFFSEARAAVTLALAPAILTTAMAFNQVRWWGLACALLVPVLAALFRALDAEPSPRRARALAIACGLFLLPGLLAALQSCRAARQMTRDDFQALVERDVAQWLRQRAGDRPVVVAGSPTVTTALVFFGGLQGLGTLYWENNDGLHAAAELYAARDDTTARALIERHHLTHLVVVTWDGFEGIYTRLIRGLSADEPIPADAFIARLLPAPVPPPWLRVVPFQLSPQPELAGAQVRIYEVVSEQTPAAATAHAADAALEAGNLGAAEKFLPALGELSADLCAASARARLLFSRNDAAGFAAALPDVIAALPQARTLPLEDRVHVVTVLAMASRFDLALAELAAALASADADSLRRLSVGTLVDLLELSRVANQPWPDSALHDFAVSLAPPSTRQP